MSIEDNNDVSISGILTYEDYRKYSEYHHKKIVIGYFLSAFIIFALFMAISSIILFPGWTWVLLILTSLALALIISGILTLGLILLIRWRGRREYNSDAAIQTEMSYVINHEGIQQKRGRSNTYFKWDEILKTYENQGMFRLYVSKNKAIVLPKKFFHTKDEMELFKEIIRENMDLERRYLI